jgi:hypothetical protein
VRLYLDIDTRKFVASASEQRPVTGIEVKRRDTGLIELQFVRDRVVQELPAGTTIRLGLKPAANYTAEFLASGTFTKSGTGTSTKYLLDLNLNTVALNTAFAAATPEPETLAAMLEVEWASGSNISSSLTLPVTIANDVIRGNEGTPATLPIFYTSTTSNFLATQAEAEAGTDNTKWMSPLRVFQSIVAWIANNPMVHWDSITEKPDDFPPGPHSHSAADITSGTISISRIPAGTTSTTVCLGNDSRLSDSRTPTSHTHGNISNLGAIGTTSGIPIITGTSGVLQAGSFGSTAGTFCQGNDSRLSDSRTPTTHTHTLSNLTQSGAATGQVAAWNGSAWAPATPSSGNALSQQVSSIAGVSNHNLTANRWHIFTGSPSGSQHTFRLPENATNGDLIYITFQTTGVTNLEVQRFNYGSTGFVALSSNLEPGKTYLFHYNDFETARWRKVTFA